MRLIRRWYNILTSYQGLLNVVCLCTIWCPEANDHALLRARLLADNQAFTNWASRVMVISSPTRIPPVSRAAFQVKPKSLRLILVLAEIPIRVFPQGSLAGGVGPSTAKRTLRVTPRIVRSPSTDNSPSPATLMPVDLKCKVGNFSTWKKSALFR